jgi:hypothetical protein
MAQYCEQPLYERLLKTCGNGKTYCTTLDNQRSGEKFSPNCYGGYCVTPPVYSHGNYTSTSSAKPSNCYTSASQFFNGGKNN